MTRKCSITNKKANNGYAVSHSHIRTKKIQNVNLQWKKIWDDKSNKFIRMKLSTKAIKTLLIRNMSI
uniref:Large ribosomal subunit protein bL28c n=1 Tax=Corynoplastis japonica TaxID=700918 RepID=A0A1X9PU23_9RHOD|nr:50S ribosomal protein L28 [Corynoplastis japonica]